MVQHDILVVDDWLAVGSSVIDVLKYVNGAITKMA